MLFQGRGHASYGHEIIWRTGAIFLLLCGMWDIQLSLGPLSGRPTSASSRQHFVPLSPVYTFFVLVAAQQKKMRHALRKVNTGASFGHFLISQKKKERRRKRRRKERRKIDTITYFFFQQGRMVLAKCFQRSPESAWSRKRRLGRQIATARRKQSVTGTS